MLQFLPALIAPVAGALLISFRGPQAPFNHRVGAEAAPLRDGKQPQFASPGCFGLAPWQGGMPSTHPWPVTADVCHHIQRHLDRCFRLRCVWDGASNSTLGPPDLFPFQRRNGLDCHLFCALAMHAAHSRRCLLLVACQASCFMGEKARLPYIGEAADYRLP